MTTIATFKTGMLTIFFNEPMDSLSWDPTAFYVQEDQNQNQGGE